MSLCVNKIVATKFTCFDFSSLSRPACNVKYLSYTQRDNLLRQNIILCLNVLTGY